MYSERIKRHVITLEDRLAMTKYYEMGEKVVAVAWSFKMIRANVSTIVQRNQDKVLARMKSEASGMKIIKKIGKMLFKKWEVFFLFRLLRWIVLLLVEKSLKRMRCLYLRTWRKNFQMRNICSLRQVNEVSWDLRSEEVITSLRSMLNVNQVTNKQQQNFLKNIIKENCFLSEQIF